MRLDTHQHFWNFNEEEFGWIDEDMAVIRRSFLPDDLQKILGKTGFDGTIAVQARQSVEGTEFLLSLAEEHSFIKGVVGWVDLCSPNVKEQLERYSKHPLFKGVRHVLQDEPDERFMLREDFQNGIRLLEEFDLTYDLLIYPNHLPYAMELVKEFPNQPFVVDHIAKPSIKEGKIEPWKSDIEKLAQFPNVYCKLSGMVTEADIANWEYEDFLPYLDAVFAAFGSERLMIGSDWPVCTVGGEYQSVIGIVTRYLEQFSGEIRDNILWKNGARFYKV